MLLTALLRGLCVWLLIRPSYQSPVKSKASVKTLPFSESSTSGQYTTIKPPLYELIDRRPPKRSVYSLKKFQEEFAAHPDVKRIKLDGDKFEIAEQFQALRGNHVNRPWHTKMTATVDEYLEKKKASKEVMDTVSTLNHKQRRDSSRRRSKSKLTLEERDELNKKERVRKQANYGKLKDQRKRKRKGRTDPIEELFKMNLDQHVGDQKLTSFDIVRQADRFRLTYFTSELAYRNALRSYLHGKGFDPRKITLALTKRSQLKEEEHSLQVRVATTASSKQSASTSRTQPEDSLSSHSSSTDADGQVSPNTEKSNAGILEQFDGTSWWDRQGW